MLPVRSVSDPRNKFAEISEDVHEGGRPVILTRNGRGDMVVMSMESFEEPSFHPEVLVALRKAEREAAISENASRLTRSSWKPAQLSQEPRAWNPAVYRAEILPSARCGVVEAVRYMAQTLGSPQATERFLD